MRLPRCWPRPRSRSLLQRGLGSGSVSRLHQRPRDRRGVVEGGGDDVAGVGVDLIDGGGQLREQTPEAGVPGLLHGELVVAGVDLFEAVVDLAHHGAPLVAVLDADLDRDRVGHGGRGVDAVADLHAQLVRPGAEVDDAFGLTLAQVQVIGVARDRRARVHAPCVGDDVEVARTLVHLAGFLDDHAVGGQLDGDAAGDRRPVRRAR